MILSQIKQEKMYLLQKLASVAYTVVCLVKHIGGKQKHRRQGVVVTDEITGASQLLGARAQAASLKSTPMGLACTVQSLERIVERIDQSHQNPNLTLCIDALVFNFDLKVGS